MDNREKSKKNISHKMSRNLAPDSPYNLLNANGDPPIGSRPRRITPSISNAMPKEGLKIQIEKKKRKRKEKRRI